MGLIEDLDSLIYVFLSGWNVYTTAIAISLVGVVAWVAYDSQEPDIHPLLLARQGSASLVRQPGESAVYRSHETPQGYPLKSGLAVKPPGAPIWSSGKDGDLRDIWRRVLGAWPLDPKSEEKTMGKILTVLGREQTVEHDLGDLTKEVKILGKHFTDHNISRVAVYLPNSVEFLTALFAAAFGNFTIILIPYSQPHPNIISLLNESKADALIAQAGSLPLAEVSKQVPKLRQVTWVVEKTSRHVDWSEVPEGFGGKVDVAVWHELVQDARDSTSSELPDYDIGSPTGNIVFIWQNTEGKGGEVVEFTQGNVTAGVSSFLSALPSKETIKRSDLVLPAESLTHSYALTVTLASIFAQATVALNSVAGSGVKFGLVVRNIAPTVIVMSAETAALMHSTGSSSSKSATKSANHTWQSRMLKAGRMPTGGSFGPLASASLTGDASNTSKLRLLLVSERAGADTPPLSSEDLADLRIFTHARVIYALTAAKVAGAVAQTHLFDYRTGMVPRDKHSHFGTPLSSIEFKFVDTPSHKTTDERPAGDILVAGPAVLGGRTSLGVHGTIRDDGTLAYA